jgi:hypothetical protein
MCPLLFGHIDGKRCLWRHERTPWRRRLAPLCPVFGLGGSKHHLLGHDIILEGLGFGGVGLFDDDLAHLYEGRPFHMKIWPLDAQGLPQRTSTSCSLCQNVTLKGYDVIIYGFLHL